MYSIDFEEFLWTKGYNEELIEDLYNCMKELKPLTSFQFEAMLDNFIPFFIS